MKSSARVKRTYRNFEEVFLFQACAAVVREGNEVLRAQALHWPAIAEVPGELHMGWTTPVSHQSVNLILSLQVQRPTRCQILDI